MTDNASMQIALAKVRDRFVGALPDREAAVGSLLQEIDQTSVSENGLREAQLHLHQMAGTAATLGFKELGDVSCACEDEILGLDLTPTNFDQLAFKLRQVLRLMAEAQRSRNADR